ncbi:drug/metabolite transporter, DME family [Quadrisphaera granulorum]|uniref:DME family drug/metabolite transporter n=1 Tax=Quadrisphaera granulorum TaxID=317664 RepID=A0A316ABF0_9ACTN|nr:DMT family transporter [Quadrisphaera granulorum]PWJ54961.1 DME family drug/metabolite transporter [Quadrisphaera granulorum]SZE95907.1 drug/metabolite transporter, DME family [Quadrisphaera granulorum]
MTNRNTPATPHSLTNRRQRRLGLAQVCAAAVLWGTAPVALAATHSLPVVAASAGRLLLGAAALWCLTAATGTVRQTWQLLRRRPLVLLAIGAGVAAYQTLWFAAIVNAGAAIATVIALGVAPVLLTAWDALRARRRPSASRLLAVGLALAGLWLVATSQSHAATVAVAVPVGIGLAVLSGMTFAATTVLARRTATQSSPLPMTALTTTAAALLLLPAVPLTLSTISVDTTSAAAIAYMGLLTVAVAFLLLNSGLRKTTASTAAVASLLEPATTAVLAVLLLGEVLSWTAWLGTALTISAVAMLAVEGDAASELAPR